ncbi:MAG: PTS glucitol/sorbitol transporter subunit IIA [Eubacterium sp.]
MYKSEIVGIGPMVQELVEAGQFFIVFNENAPAELAEMSVLHTVCNLEKEVTVGDTIVFGDKEYQVTAVGNEANHTLATMGHCTMKFTGLSEVELPGQIELDGNGVVPKVKPGDRFEIKFA